ncbi:hypothetical protein JOD43_002074 [Pullulanibacillus pueri]|nr:hypothetical protein [Pullulanibacillus pueri]
MKRVFTKSQHQRLVDWNGRRETPAGTARVRRSTWEPHYIIPKLAEAVPAESERSGVEINALYFINTPKNHLINKKGRP